MKIYQIDEKGFIIKTLELNVADKSYLPFDYIGDEPPKDLKEPRWNGKEWVEGDVNVSK